MTPVRVRRIRIKNAFQYKTADVEIPETGIVLVTGENGEGKSALMEAVAVALWGKTIRGTEAFRQDTAGEIEVTLDDGFRVLRTCTKKGTKKLRVFDGDDEVKYENTTKAKHAIAQRVGDQKVWQRCSMFTSADAAVFSDAGDKARKELIESILGLSAYDDALKKARKDRKAIETDLRDAERDVFTQEGKASSLKAQLRAKKQELEEHRAAPPATLNAKILRRTVEDCAEEMRMHETRLLEIRAELGALEEPEDRSAEISVLKHRIKEEQKKAKLFASGLCPTCGGNASSHKLSAGDNAKALEAELASIERAAATDAKIYAKVYRPLAEEEASLREEVVELRSRIRRAEPELKAIEAKMATWEAQTAFLEDAIKTLRKDKVSAMDALEEAEIVCDDLAREVKTMKVVEQVLGPRGIRAYLLSDALEGIETVANSWLARFGSGIQIAISPVKQNKDDSYVETIDIQVDGAGGGFGYKACSGGQRRRIDIALLLALAEIASAAAGHDSATMFCDEVFDWLDAEGMSLVSEVLSELAATKSIVIISHREDIKDMLDVSLHVHVSNHEVRPV